MAKHITIKCNLYYPPTHYNGYTFTVRLDEYIRFIRMQGIFIGKNQNRVIKFRLDNASCMEVIESDYEEVTKDRCK